MTYWQRLRSPIRSLPPRSGTVLLALVLTSFLVLTGWIWERGDPTEYENSATVQAPLSISPDTVHVTLPEGRREVTTITLTNNGTFNSSWSLSRGESASNGLAAARTATSSAPRESSTRGGQRLLGKAADEGRVRVIAEVDVRFSPEKSLSRAEVESQRRRISRVQERVVSAIGPDPSTVWTSDYTPVVALEVTRDELDRLLGRDDVVRVVEDVAEPLHLSTSTEVVGATDAFSQGITGSGQAVAVLDAGIETEHPFLRASAVREACFSTESSSSNTNSLCPNGRERQTGEGAACNPTMASCNHGTHVSGIAVGEGDGRTGMAPDADLIAIQVFSRFNDSDACDGNPPCQLAFVSDQLQALEYVYSIRDEHNIAAINMSLGGGGDLAYCNDDPRTSIMRQLRSAGIATVTSAGNGGLTEQVSSPACISHSMAIGSVGDGSDGTVLDAVTSFSNSAWTLDFWAPGEQIESSVGPSGFLKFSGTSMSSPHVAGAWALLKSRWPGASVAEVHARLDDAGVFVTDSRNGITRPRLEVGGALTQEEPVLAGPRFGTVPPDGTGKIHVVVDATQLTPGTYEDTFTIASEGEQEQVVVSTEVMTSEPARASVQPASLTAAVRTGKPLELEQTVTNSADSSAQFLRVQVGLPDFLSLLRVSGEGVVVSDTTVRIEPQSTATLVYGFQKSEERLTVYSGGINLETNDPDTPQISVPAEVTVQVPRVAVDPSVLDFGVVPTGEPSVSEVTITNIGSALFVATSVISSGEDQFTVVENRGPVSVPPGGDLAVSVESEAGATEIRRGALEISHDAVNLDSPIEVNVQSAPGELILRPPFPNPLEGTATIEYSIPEAGDVRISVYDVLGRRVAVLRDEQQEAGIHQIQWRGRSPSGRPLADGAYFVRLRAGDAVRTEKLTIIR